jgi:eukaryotic-like serine/threonine-protein kinase
MDGLRDARSETCPRCGRPAVGTERFCLVCKTAMPFASSNSDDADTAITPLPTSDCDRGTTRILPAAVQRTSDDAPTSALTPQPADGQSTGDRPGGSDAESGPLTIGQRFGRYTIARLLGIGGMGAVYQAWDEELEVVVALKVIRPEVRRDPRAEQDIERRFKRELLLARQVTHKNVVRIHDLGEIGGIKYITMSYVDGTDLASLLRQEGRLPVPRALRIIRSVVEGLVAAHAAGVVHRDLKPANIMIDANGDALIMDFGIARSAGGPMEAPGAAASSIGTLSGVWQSTARHADVTMAGTVVGTVEYMAPEQARGQQVDQRADVYATGLMLYDLLIGRRRAQQAESPIAELRARMEHPLPPVKLLAPEVPIAVAAIVERAIERDETRRYQTTAELAADLGRLDENGDPLPLVRRLTPRLVAATAVLVIAMLGGTYFLTRRAVEPPKQHPPVSVLIADFQNRTGDAAFDRTLEPRLRRALQTSSFISAYDRSAISGTIGVKPPDVLDETAARVLAANQGLGIVLSGAIDRQSNGYGVSVKAAQTVTGAVVVERKARAATKNEVLGVATKLVADVRKALGDEVPESQQLFAMRSLSASSLDVVSYYAAAIEAQAKGKFEDARQSYLKAVALDPKFGLGYQGLAVMSRNLNRPDEADKYIKEALRYVDGMTEREKYGTRGFYFRMIGDNQQCASSYGESLAKYPADSVAHNQRAVCLAKLRQMKEARGEMQQAVQMLPNHAGYRTNLALLAALAGDFAAAETEVQKLPQANERSLQVLAYSQLGRGLLTEAAGTYQKLGKIGGTQGPSSAASGLGDLAVYKGRFAEAVRILEQGAAADLAAKNPDRAAIKFASSAYAHLMAGHQGAAVAAADKALQNSKSMPVRFLAARIFVEAGAIDKARPLAAALSMELPAEPQTHGKIIEGLIALKTGSAREAIKTLIEANGVLDTWFGHFDLGRAYLAAGALTQADFEFDRCIARRGEALSLMDEGPTYGHFPFVYYYRGLVKEQSGNARFADSYREYLRIRAESKEDPLLPEVRRRAGQ